MSSPPQNPWLAVLPWLIAGVALFALAVVGGFGAAYVLSTGQAVATVDPAKLPTPTPLPTPSGAAVTPTAAVTPSASASPQLSPTAAPSGPASPSASAGSSAGPTASPISYTVQRGDRLRDIAQQFGVTVEAIVQLNNLDDPDHIEAGQVLLIPVP